MLPPGKGATRLRWTSLDSGGALAAKSVRSASLWRRKVALGPERLRQGRDHRRDHGRGPRADFRAALGEDPGR